MADIPKDCKAWILAEKPGERVTDKVRPLPASSLGNRVFRPSDQRTHGGVCASALFGDSWLGNGPSGTAARLDRAARLDSSRSPLPPRCTTSCGASLVRDKRF